MNDSQTRWTWHFLSWVSPVVMAAIFLVVMVTLAGGFEPFLFIFGAILLITGLVGRRFPRRAGPITVLVVTVVFLLMNLTVLIEDLAHPDSFMNFAVFGVFLLALTITAVVGSIAQLASRPDGAALKVAYGALALMVISVVVSVVAVLGLEDDVAASGDLRLTAEDVEYAPANLSGSGTVAVFVENKDPFRHTFAIEALGIEVELPASTNRRVEVSAAPGAYEFICTVGGHEDMKGVLTIGG